ncbi:MAG: TetR/AcrR family transcriptional regulator [Deltaproteobacteria bacterium]|nr:TetR/AcrR family transcriptional regulator [Deltaproteobacteria bacterium]
MPDKNLKKQLIIEAAIDVFSKNNFQNSTISQIAQKAEVAEGTIYQYFKNKEDLFFSIPVEKTKDFCRELELHLQGITGAFNKIRKFIWYYLYFFKMNPEYGRTLMLEMRVNKSFAKTKAYDSFKNLTDRILEIIKEGQEEGIIRKDVNIFITRQLILGILEHVVTRWLLKGEQYDLLEHCDEVNKLIIHGIGLTTDLNGLKRWREGQ